MHFLLWSRIGAHNIRENLGAPEYSYYFLLREFLPAFERLGQTRVLQEIAEADTVHDELRASGESCVLIAFTAPHNLPAPARCPVVPLIAWEFDRIPDESWDGDERNDWRAVLARSGRAITLSEFAVRSLRAALGPQFPVCALPVPAWDRLANARERCVGQAREARRLLVDGAVLDLHAYEVGATRLRPRDPWRSFECRLWDGAPLELDFSRHAAGVGALGGFYLAEDWGSWSRNDEAWVLLPCFVSGRIAIELQARAYGPNVERPLLVGCGSEYHTVSLGAGVSTLALEFAPARPVRMLHLRGIDLVPPAGGSDDRTLGIGLARLCLRALDGTQPEGESVDFGLGADAPAAALLNGFNATEPWGVWSCDTLPAILLPRAVCGRVWIYLEGMAHAGNAGRRLRAHLGTQTREFVLEAAGTVAAFDFDLAEPAQVLCISGSVPEPEGADGSGRLLGIGLRRVTVHGVDGSPCARPAAVPAHVRHELPLDGVVFTSVLNPRDDRKNWELMIASFCAAFAQTPDAMLVLKMTHHTQSSYLFELHYLLQRLPPFRCRIVLVHGFLDDEAYAELVARTDFYFNLSKSEGLCIPAMEFMACGKPVVAPRHTSMLDFLDDTNSIPVAAGTEPCGWPHDTRQVLRALRYRIEQDSAIGALQHARRLLLEDPESCRRMGEAARARMAAYCSLEAVTGGLREFFGVRAPAVAREPTP